MVEANPVSDHSMEFSAASQNEFSMIVDEGTVEVVIKPRNTFSNGALRRVVPPIDLRKKK